MTLVHGSMADKDVDGIIQALDGSNALKGACIIATQVPGERAMPATELGRRWRATRPDATITMVADVGMALERALASADGPVIIAGSLYLVGEARRRWLDDPRLRDPEDPGT
jgi:folylpolyglutamate synthase/dihydropteroate synthase